MNGTLLTAPETKERINRMRAIRFRPGWILSSLAALLSAGQAINAESAQPAALVEGNTSFALDLYTQLKTSPGNVFSSPYSTSTCLAITYAGARGDTEKRMARVLHFPPGQVHSSFGELQRQLSKTQEQKGIQMNIANALWAQQGHP